MKCKALIAIALALLGVDAFAQGAGFTDTAQIIDVRITNVRYNAPQNVCNQPQMIQQPVERGVSGAIIGGLAGGILGNGVGRGGGKALATGIGAITGTIVGDRLQNNGASYGYVAGSCYTVDNMIERPGGAIVTYNYQGRTFTESLPYVPNFRAGDQVALQVRTTLGSGQPFNGSY